MSENLKIKRGLAEIAYAEHKIDNEGNVTYGDVISFRGSRKVSAKPEGESTTVYADSQAAMEIEVNDGYTIVVEMLKLDKVRNHWLGLEGDEKTGYSEFTDAPPRTGFCLITRDITTDGAGEINYYPNCTAKKRPEVAGETEEDKLKLQFEQIEIKSSATKDLLARHITYGTAIPKQVPAFPKNPRKNALQDASTK